MDKSILTIDELDNIVIGLKSIESISNDFNMNLFIDKLSLKQEDIISISSNIFINLTSFYKASLSQKIILLREALSRNQEVVLDYFSLKGPSTREIEPYFITFKWSECYVFGYCKLRQDFRLFKLNRISYLKIVNKQFTRRDIYREKLDLNTYFQSEQKAITMLIDRSVEYQIVDSYGADSYEITEDNRIKFDLVYTSHHYAMEFIQSLGDKVYVISPQSIIDELKTNAENTLKMYKRT